MTLYGTDVEVTANIAGMYDLIGTDVEVIANIAGMYDLIGTDVEVAANIAGNMTYMELMLRSQLTLLVCMTLFGINVEVTADESAG